ncbi:unnamed protein product [Camellia sinensis]
MPQRNSRLERVLSSKSNARRKKDPKKDDEFISETEQMTYMWNGSVFKYGTQFSSFCNLLGKIAIQEPTFDRIICEQVQIEQDEEYL